MNAPVKSLFRKSAIDHYLSSEELGGVLSVSPPWTWGLFAATATAVVTALIGATWASVEVTGRGRGILRPAGGVRLLAAQVGGTVAEVVARSSDAVRAESVVVRLDSATLRSQLLEAEREIHLLESDYRAYSSGQDAMFAEQKRHLVARLVMLAEQATSQEQSVALFERKLEATRGLQRSGLVSEMNLEDAREAVSQASRQAVSIRHNLTQARQELAALETRRQDDLWNRQRDLLSSRSRRDALAVTLGQLEIRAPVSGAVEAILVRPGDVVQPGQVIGRLIPRGQGFQVVSFLPEKDRAFLKEQDEVRLEMDQFPATEFGAMRGRVARIGDDLASPIEIREAMGEEARIDTPTYRVEIQIEEASGRRVGQLRTGMLMDVRYTLRRQRLLTLLLEPLRRWLD